MGRREQRTLTQLLTSRLRQGQPAFLIPSTSMILEVVSGLTFRSVRQLVREGPLPGLNCPFRQHGAPSGRFVRDSLPRAGNTSRSLPPTSRNLVKLE